METTETPISSEPASSGSNWYQSGWFSHGFLLVAGLFFLLPFININCSGNKLASIKGIDMVLGADLKPNLPEEEKEIVPAKADSLKASADSVKKEFDTDFDSLTQGLTAIADSISTALVSKENPFTFPGDMMGDKNKRIDPNPLAITSFAAILLGLILSFFPARIMSILSGIFSAISALSLFYLQMQANSEMQKQMGPLNFIPVTLEFTSYYWLCVLLTVLAAVFSFIRSATKKSNLLR